jgi:hypothetical protein
MWKKLSINENISNLHLEFTLALDVTKSQESSPFELSLPCPPTTFTFYFILWPIPTVSTLSNILNPQTT